MWVEYELRNLPRSRVVDYLEQAGGVVRASHQDEVRIELVGDGWTAILEALAPAQVGSCSVPRDCLMIEGDDPAVERVSAWIRQKTMRGGG